MPSPYSGFSPGEVLFRDDAEDFFFAHDEEVFAVELDLGARVLAEQNGVAGLDVEWEHLALVVGLAFSDGDDGALLGLLFCGIRDDDASAHGFALFSTGDE